MNKKIFWLSMIGIIASFIGGFFLANALNKNELSALRLENENLKKTQSEAKERSEELSLSGEEIEARIKQADKNPTDIAFQKNLGTALYNYAVMKKNGELLADVSRLLNRVYESNPNDYESVIAMGNINFDIGYFNQNNDNFQRARIFYQKALERKPDDAEARTDLGLTYFLSNPPDADAAIAEFQKSLKVNPKNEKALQAIIEALNSQNKNAEAEKYTARLREVNPGNQLLQNQAAPPFGEAENNQPKQ